MERRVGELLAKRNEPHARRRASSLQSGHRPREQGGDWLCLVIRHEHLQHECFRMWEVVPKLVVVREAGRRKQGIDSWHRVHVAVRRLIVEARGVNGAFGVRQPGIVCHCTAILAAEAVAAIWKLRVADGTEFTRDQPCARLQLAEPREGVFGTATAALPSWLGGQLWKELRRQNHLPPRVRRW